MIKAIKNPRVMQGCRGVSGVHRKIIWDLGGYVKAV